MIYYISIRNDDNETGYFSLDFDDNQPLDEYFIRRTIRTQYPNLSGVLSWNSVIMVHETQVIGSYLENESDILLFLDTEKPF